MSMSQLPGKSLFQDPNTALPTDERRSSPRYHLRLEITLRGDNNFYTGITQDLSEGGVFIATHKILPIGTPVVMEFYLSRYDIHIKVEGIVRWVRQPQFGDHVPDMKTGMGIQFGPMGPTESKVIKEFMGLRNPELFD